MLITCACAEYFENEYVSVWRVSFLSVFQAPSTPMLNLKITDVSCCSYFVGVLVRCFKQVFVTSAYAKKICIYWFGFWPFAYEFNWTFAIGITTYSLDFWNDLDCRILKRAWRRMFPLSDSQFAQDCIASDMIALPFCEEWMNWLRAALTSLTC